MKSNLPLFSLAVALLGPSSVARADINAPLEGSYGAACQKITITAAFAKTMCEEAPDGQSCNTESTDKPVELHIPCSREELQQDVETLREDCLQNTSLAVTRSDGTQIDYSETACNAAIALASAGANAFADFTNGEFSIDVATNTWFSSMEGRFTNQFGQSLSLPYATANLPWSSGFSFLMGAAIPLPVKLLNVCDGQAVVSGASGGRVVKATGALELNYNLNTTVTCNHADGSSVQLTLNGHADFAGTKRP